MKSVFKLNYFIYNVNGKIKKNYICISENSYSNLNYLFYWLFITVIASCCQYVYAQLKCQNGAFWNKMSVKDQAFVAFKLLKFQLKLIKT